MLERRAAPNPNTQVPGVPFPCSALASRGGPPPAATGAATEAAVAAATKTEAARRGRADGSAWGVVRQASGQASALASLDPVWGLSRLRAAAQQGPPSPPPSPPYEDEWESAWPAPRASSTHPSSWQSAWPQGNGGEGGLDATAVGEEGGDSGGSGAAPCAPATASLRWEGGGGSCAELYASATVETDRRVGEAAAETAAGRMARAADAARADAWQSAWRSEGEAEAGGGDDLPPPLEPTSRGVHWAPMPPRHIATGWRMHALNSQRGHVENMGSAWPAESAWNAPNLVPPQASGARAGLTAAERAEAMQRSLTLQERMRRCGLDDPLDDWHRDEWRGLKERGDAVAVVQRLRESMAARVASVVETDRVRTAVAAFEEFLLAADRKPFVDPSAAGGTRYNQETLDMFTEWLRARGSRRRGAAAKVVTSAHISATVSAIRLLRERSHRGRVTVKENNLVGPQLLRQMRKEDGPRATRKLSCGIRMRHLRVAMPLLDQNTKAGRRQAAAALLAHNAVLRGGELGVTKKGTAVDPSRNITASSFDWDKEQCAESRGRPWLILDLVGIKDGAFRNRVVPTPICRRWTFEEVPAGGDACCVYDALRAVWLDRVAHLPLAQRAYRGGCTEPFFLGDDGKTWCTADSQRLAQWVAEKAGLQVDHTGGKAFRIGGATDLRDVFGEAGRRMIMERGRWGTDVAQVYQRALLRDQLDASAGAAAASSRDLEEVVAGWAQPAVYYTIRA